MAETRAETSARFGEELLAQPAVARRSLMSRFLVDRAHRAPRAAGAVEALSHRREPGRPKPAAARRLDP